MKNAKPHARFRILNACFTNAQHRYWTREELLTRLAEHDIIIEARTLDHDLQSMRQSEQLGYYAPIKYCRLNKGYHYEDPAYSIEVITIIDDELRSLLFCRHVYQQFKGSALVEKVDRVIDKMLTAAGRNVSHKPETIIVHDTVMYCKGLEHLDVLLHAVYHQQAVVIAHQKFGEEKITNHVLHPYFLKTYQGRTYVYGKSEKRNINLTFALDRMVTVEESDVAFIANKSIKPDDFFRNILGVTMGKGPVETIELWFTPMQGHYIKSKPLHESQQVVQDDDAGLIITLQLIPNYELISLLLSFGNAVNVLAPERVREEIKEVLAGALLYYQDC